MTKLKTNRQRTRGPGSRGHSDGRPPLEKVAHLLTRRSLFRGCGKMTRWLTTCASARVRKGFLSGSERDSNKIAITEPYAAAVFHKHRADKVL
jgi:hypothetical protein